MLVLKELNVPEHSSKSSNLRNRNNTMLGLFLFFFFVIFFVWLC